jgi:hypothetical protein
MLIVGAVSRPFIAETKRTKMSGKGIILRDSDTSHNYTFYGGNNTKANAYKTFHIPGYDRDRDIADPQSTCSALSRRKAETWNNYQSNTWYQTYLNNLERDECPPGVQAEFREPGVVEREVNLVETGNWKYDVHNSKTGRICASLKGTREEAFDATDKKSTDWLESKKAQRKVTARLTEEDHRPVGSFRPHTTPPSTYFQTSHTTNRPIIGEPKDETTLPNPRTMFLQEIKRPIFGEVGEKKEHKFTHTASRPKTAGSSESPFSSFRDSGANEPQTLSFSRRSGHQASSLATRTMSSTALSHRHAGVDINSSDRRGEPTKTTLTGLLNPTHRRPHPTSGYERGLRGTLLLNEWRAQELMGSDGKICFHPLSYDVLETITYGPADPNRNPLEGVKFVSL